MHIGLHGDEFRVGCQPREATGIPAGIWASKLSLAEEYRPGNCPQDLQVMFFDPDGCPYGRRINQLIVNYYPHACEYSVRFFVDSKPCNHRLI